LRKFRRILRKSLALRFFRLLGTVLLLLLLILLMQAVEMTMMMTMATTTILLLQGLLDQPVPRVRPVPPVMAKARLVVVVEAEEVVAAAMVDRQVCHIVRLVRNPASVFSFRLSPRLGMPSTSGIDIPRLPALPSRISGTRILLTVPIRPNLTRFSPSAISISPNARRISPPMTTKSFS
jgi:hypothetical protein